MDAFTLGQPAFSLASRMLVLSGRIAVEQGGASNEIRALLAWASLDHNSHLPGFVPPASEDTVLYEVPAGAEVNAVRSPTVGSSEGTTKDGAEALRPRVLHLLPEGGAAKNLGDWEMLLMGERGGPRDPRMAPLRGGTVLVFRHGVRHKRTKQEAMHIFVHHMRRIHTVRVAAPEGGDDIAEGEWLPLEIDGTLHLVHSLTPHVKVLRLGDLFDDWEKGVTTGTWLTVTERSRAQNSCASLGWGQTIKDKRLAPITGGSPFRLWRWPYYVALTHAHGSTHDGLDSLLKDTNFPTGAKAFLRRASLHGNASVQQQADTGSYRGLVLTILNVEQWHLFCSRPGIFQLRPPPAPAPADCRKAYTGNGTARRAHSLDFTPDGRSVAIGIDFDGSCPAVGEVALSDFATAFDATLHRALVTP